MKIALIIGKIDRGTIKTCLQTNQFSIKRKYLNTSVKNWESICVFLESDTEHKIVVLSKFSELDLIKMCHPQYEKVTHRLLSLLEKKKHVIFIYKNNLLGTFSFKEGFCHEFTSNSIMDDIVDDYPDFGSSVFNSKMNSNPEIPF